MGSHLIFRLAKIVRFLVKIKFYREYSAEISQKKLLVEQENPIFGAILKKTWKQISIFTNSILSRADCTIVQGYRWDWWMAESSKHRILVVLELIWKPEHLIFLENWSDFSRKSCIIPQSLGRGGQIIQTKFACRLRCF